MARKTLKRRSVFLVAAVALAGVGALGGSAQAEPGQSYIGPGKPNEYEGVMCTQILANMLHWQTGYHVVAEDGHFGPDTYGAIKAVQKWASLPQDGIVGPQTGTVLLESTKDGDGIGCYWHLPSYK
ncbi:peptidoglycan-binding domain-containing protein [Kitasatospora indigofera]|uniref:peptidoglycan-binding domain-containing protein n=1 Tax=Kitasatospora indigofera TaxID=67307 RepID=UPI00324C1EA3